MQYILIQTTPEAVTRQVDVLQTRQIEVLVTSQVGSLTTSGMMALTTTQIESFTVQQIESFTPVGTQMFQCVTNGNVVGHKTLDGVPCALLGGSEVIDPLPPIPTWAPEYTGA